jgi:hypothetical protein
MVLDSKTIAPCAAAAAAAAAAHTAGCMFQSCHIQVKQQSTHCCCGARAAMSTLLQQTCSNKQ